MTRWPGRARIAIVSGATAAGLAAVLAGASFALQAVALPRPSDGQLIAAKSLRWLTRQRAMESMSAGQAGSTVCVNASVRLAPATHPVRGSLLISKGSRVVDTKTATFRVGRRLREIDGRSASLAAVLAGCPHALERRLGRFLDQRARVTWTPLFDRGVRVLLITFAGPKQSLSLLVRARTFVPIAVRLGGARRRWHHLAPAEKRDLRGRRLRLPGSFGVVIESRA